MQTGLLTIVLITAIALGVAIWGLIGFSIYKRRKLQRPQQPIQQQPNQQPDQQPEKLAKKIWRWSLETAVILVIGFLIFFYIPNFILSHWQIQRILKELMAGTIIAAEIGLILGAIFLIQWLAANDLFWTIVKPKQAKIRLTFGGSPKVLEGKTKESGLVRKFFGGIRWISIPYIHSIYHYKFHWLSFKQEEVNGRLVYKATEEGDDDYYYVSLKDEVYFAVAEGAESADGVPIDIYFQLTLRVEKVLLAIFEVENWLEAVLSLFRPILTDFIRQKELTELIGMPRKRRSGQPPTPIRLLVEARKMIDNSEIVTHINNQYGVIVVPNGFGIADIIIRDPKFADALTQKWLAEREAERIEEVYSAIEARGDTGKMVRTLEALERASEKPSKTLIFPVGGINDLMSLWIGKRRRPNHEKPNHKKYDRERYKREGSDDK